MADRQGGCAVEQAVQLVHAAVVDGELEQGVLHHGVLDVVLAQLGAQSGVLGHSDALVVHQHTGGGVLQLIGQIGHNGLLLAENLCIRHSCFHLH